MWKNNYWHYVYELIDSENKVIYVGETVNPGTRFREHIRKKSGKFYGRTDIKMCIIPEMFITKKHAYWKQIELQKKYNLIPDNEKQFLANIRKSFSDKSKKLSNLKEQALRNINNL